MTQNNFLGDMQTVITGQLECLRRYEMEGNKGGSLWLSKDSDGTNSDLIGRELIKIGMPYEMFEQKKAEASAGKLIFPCQVQIVCKIVMGGGNKAAITAISMKLDVPEPEQIEDKDIDKTTGEILTGKDSDKDKPKTTSPNLNQTGKN